jgi:hypothetical protein
MGIITIQRAVRAGCHLLISLAGPSGSGKTMSAILLARGLVGPSEKIGFLDTETGRGRLYADIAGGFDYAELTPPFSPDRYSEAIAEFEAARFKVLIIDSGSHEHEGIGGILEMKESSQAKNDIAKWAAPKAKHKRYMSRLLASRMHIIVCLRAREKLKEVTRSDGKKEWLSDGYHEIAEKNFIFEMSLSMMLSKGGFPVLTKCPAAIEHAFPADQRIGIKAGEVLAQWVAGGAPVDHALETLRRRAEEAAGKGAECFRAYWKATSATDRGKLQPLMDNLRSIAIAADAERERQQQTAVQQDTSGPDTSLDDPFGASSAQAKGGASAGFAVVSSDGEVKWAGGNPADFTEHLIQALVNAGSPGDLAALEMENSTDIARLAADQRARIAKAIDERRALFGKSDAAA